MSDNNELLLLVALGSEKALEELRRRLGGRVWAMAKRVGKYAHLVDDVASTTWLEVWYNAQAYRGESQVSTWILGIARNCALKASDRWERGAYKDIVNVTSFEDRVDPYDHFEDVEIEEESQLVMTVAMRGLVIPCRAFKLYYYQHKSIKEIAEILDIPTETVKSRLFSARRRLKELLDV
jgi:RNA polymerase sigma-70 factor (ECF subfamily)